jgi:predicted negative regulator of RcsB-dependent stress response
VQSYTRRQLKEDKFASTAGEAVHWASDHRRNLVFGIIAIVIVAAAVAGYYFWNNSQTDQANVLIGRAEKTFMAQIRAPGIPATPGETSFASITERGKQAEKEFKAIADQFSHTKPGKLARYMEAVAALQAGETNVGEKQLQAAIDSGDKDVASMAKLKLASLYVSSNKTGDAAKIYKDLSDHPTGTVPKAQAQLAMAEMYEATDPKQASMIYQQIEKENPNSPEAQIAKSKTATPPPPNIQR